MLGGFVCRPLASGDASELTTLLISQPPEYMHYFSPFHFDEATLLAILAGSQQDVYMGFFWDGALIAFFMLRGWDEGYEIPAYGVVVDHRYRNRGLGRLTLEMSKTICKLRSVKRLMLKVHPENYSAKHLYESTGFVQVGVDLKSNHLVYHFNFPE